jgi:hypothetical protein
MRLRKKRSRLERMLFFYPGGILIKRIGNMIVLYSIGLNLYVNFIQDQLFIESEQMITEAETALEKFQSVTDAGLQTFKNIDNMLSWSDIDWWTYGSIAAEGNKTASTIKTYQETIGGYSDRLKEYGNVYAAMSMLLKIITFLFWIRVTISMIWILSDILFGHARRPMIFFLLLGVPINIVMYKYLKVNLPLSELPETLVGGFFSAMDFLERALSSIPVTL